MSAVLVKLAADGWEAGVLPSAGGLIAYLRRDGVDVLRPLPVGSTNPLESGCFPLVPFANRVAGARFGYDGEQVQLPRNFPPEKNALHGTGWEQPWTVTAQAAFKCTLEHEHDGASGWPFAYHARQRIRVGPRGLAVSLDLTNLSDRVMPCGLGLHPYFRRRPESVVRFGSGGVVLVGEDLIPTGLIGAADSFADFGHGSCLPESLIDHCYTGWNGGATVTDDLGTITLTARGAPCLHVFNGGGQLCLEPVSHVPDALNRNPAAMTLLPPGCSATVEMTVSAS